MSVAQFFEANAGTGKTNRITETIAFSGVPFQKICAVTFTDKAANEMIDRLRQRIAQLVTEGKKKPADLDRINDCFIGTIHSFCSQLLKRYGERIGLPPLFEVDPEQSFYDELFDARWNYFISKVLKESTPPYHRLIGVPGIDGLRELATLLAARRYTFTRPADNDISWLISRLRDPAVWGFQKHRTWPGAAYKALEDAEQNRDLLLIMSEAKRPEATPWRNAIMDTLNCHTEPLYTAIEALQKDFVDGLLREYRTLGYTRFDDLIIDTRNVLRDHLEIRKQLKEKYDLVLVDEMQDTDPVQYEIFLYLCETRGSEERFTLKQLIAGEKKLRLEEGKLFVVGDPKQSIYGFRRADLTAYQRIKQVFINRNVEVQPLDQNYRSCPNIVDFTNRLAAELFQSHPPKDSIAVKKDLCADRPLNECVQLIKIDSDKATVVHLRVLTEANWLAETIQSFKNDSRYSYKDIAILLRKLTNAHLYIDALSMRGIPVVVEGEKFFFQSQEVIDFLNLLKFIVDPMDSIALAGLLRSPLFSLTDAELVAFFLEYQKNDDLLTSLQAGLEQKTQELRSTLVGFMEKISAIRSRLQDFTPGNFLDTVLKTFPVLTIASLAYGSYRSQIAPLNILKIHKEALAADSNPVMTPYRFVKTFESFSKDAKESPQEAIADEGTQAVRIISIHRAKGLDFSAVFVPLTDYAIAGRRDAVEVVHDWEKDEAGLRIRQITEARYLRLRYSPDAADLAETDPRFEKINEEERRVLYVAATRAKQQLFFCYVPNAQKNDSGVGASVFNFLSDLDERVRPQIAKAAPWFIAAATFKAREMSVRPIFEEWAKLESARSRNSGPLIRNITTEARIAVDTDEFEIRKNRAGAHAALIGSICHAALEKIEFRNPGNIRTLIDSVKWKFSNRVPARAIDQAAKEAMLVLQDFFQSAAAQWLASVEIVARELPVQFYDQANSRILTGTIDLLVNDQDTACIIDYKSNLEMDDGSRKYYRNQMNFYKRALAVEQSPIEIRALICMLRSGELIEV